MTHSHRPSNGIEMPVRVYVGSQEAQMLAVKVLEFSIRQRTRVPVQVHPLHQFQVDFPMPKDVQNRPRTPFSFQRFYIPALKDFQGRAIYVDSDMQVFRDIMELWSLPFEGADLLAVQGADDSSRRPQFSVMLLDCQALRWSLPDIVAALDRGELTYETLMYDMAVARRIRASVDPSWNSLERYVEGETALLHYTDMHTQPWVSLENPHGALWVSDLRKALERNFISREYVFEQVQKGFVRPSLVYQLDHHLDDARQLPRQGRMLDSDFVPPYKLMEAGGTRSRSLLGGMRSMIRRLVPNRE